MIDLTASCTFAVFCTLIKKRWNNAFFVPSVQGQVRDGISSDNNGMQVDGLIGGGTFGARQVASWRAKSCEFARAQAREANFGTFVPCRSVLRHERGMKPGFFQGKKFPFTPKRRKKSLGSQCNNVIDTRHDLAAFRSKLANVSWLRSYKYRFFGKYFKNGRHCFKSMAYLYSTRSGDRARCHQIDNSDFTNFCAQMIGQNAGPGGKFAQKARIGPVVRTQIPLSAQKLIKGHLHVCTMLEKKEIRPKVPGA